MMVVLRRLFLLVAVPAALGVGCRLFHTAKPTAYGAELLACENKSNSWAQYAPCCADVAARYGRDPTFCYPPNDAALPEAKRVDAP
jgi:hypothetical protein